MRPLPRLTARLLLGLVVALVAAPASVIAQDSSVDQVSWDRFDDALAAPRTSFLAAEVVDGACQPVHAVDPERRVAIASTFKLYVLGELARQVATGQAAWDEELAISDRWKSKPSGAMREEPAGTKHTLRYFAERMIAESDNTATDHLIARLGRENVEAVQRLLGHRAPELNTPLLTTRELFAFKVSVDGEWIDAYLAAPEAEKRRILAEEISSIPLGGDGWGDWVGPERIDSLEWFASAEEICTALARLYEMSRRPGLDPIARILALNRGGTVFDAGTWPYAGFKMGYEAGVVNLTWLLRRRDGRVFVVTGGFNDPANDVDQNAAWEALKQAAALLARTP